MSRRSRGGRRGRRAKAEAQQRKEGTVKFAAAVKAIQDDPAISALGVLQEPHAPVFVHLASDNAGGVHVLKPGLAVPLTLPVDLSAIDESLKTLLGRLSAHVAWTLYRGGLPQVEEASAA